MFTVRRHSIRFKNCISLKKKKKNPNETSFKGKTPVHLKIIYRNYTRVPRPLVVISAILRREQKRISFWDVKTLHQTVICIRE